MRLLLLDDDASQRRVIVRYAQLSGHQVDEASTTAEALERLGSATDVILADRNLAFGEDGLTWLRMLRVTGQAGDRRLFCLTGEILDDEPGIQMLRKPLSLALFRRALG
jgi:CheY-like chemotaxis protein